MRYALKSAVGGASLACWLTMYFSSMPKSNAFGLAGAASGPLLLSLEGMGVVISNFAPSAKLIVVVVEPSALELVWLVVPSAGAPGSSACSGSLSCGSLVPDASSGPW